MGFWQRPQASTVRRVLFQVHLWSGVIVGLYGLLIGITGAVLVFRPELQARAYPEFFAQRHANASLAAPDTVIASLRTAFPGYRFSGIDYPTYRRGTFLAYLANGDELHTVFADPVSGRVVGELPRDGWIQQLQELHFNLLAGRDGIVINGIAASCLLQMCLTGIVIWWQGAGRWRQGLAVDFRRGWKRITWELHGAIGIWTHVLLVMWAVSGIYFSFPVPFRNAVARVAPTGPSTSLGTGPSTSLGTSPSTSLGTSPSTSLGAGAQRAPLSTPAAPGIDPDAGALVDRAQELIPRAQVARIVVPSSETGSYVVVLARNVHGDFDSSDEVTLYFDQHSGELLQMADQSSRTAAERGLTWLGLLHVGTFGGLPIKLIWLVTGLAFPALFVSGLIMWWNRVVRPAMAWRVSESI